MSLINREATIEAISNQCEKIGAYSGWAELEQLKNGLQMAAVIVNEMPSAQPEWNNHTVACLLADVFGDECACNFNGIDEWLPEKCEVIDACPNPVGVACWEQYLKHRAERKTNE